MSARTGSREEQIGASLGPLCSFLTAAALAGARSSIGPANVALVLVTIVVLAAMTGPTAGATTAIVAAVSFNFFHTQPYRSLRVSDGRDLATILLLLGIGVLVGAVAEWRRRASRASNRHRHGEHVLEDVTQMLASGASTEALTAAITARLAGALRLAECRYDARPATDLALVGRSGALLIDHLRLGDGGVELPPAGAAVAVTSSRNSYGHLLLVPLPGSASTREQRRMAVALADLLAIAIDRDHAATRS